MKISSPLSLLLIFFGFAHALSGPSCPYDSVQWAQLRPTQRATLLNEIAPTALNSSPCCAQMLRRIVNSPAHAATAPALLKSFIQSNPKADLTVLYTAAQLNLPTTHPAQWKEILTLWQRSNQPFDELLSQLHQQAAFKQADSLYKLMATAPLDEYSQLRWAQLKALLGEYDASVELLCTVAERAPRLGMIAQSHLLHTLGEVDDPTAQRNMLIRFRHCRSTHHPLDSVALRSWLSSAFERFGLYEEQLNTLTALNSAAAPVSQELATLTRQHLSSQRYRLAIQSARAAWAIDSTCSTAPFLTHALYESYEKLGNADSALVWLERSSLAITPPQAIALYQQSSMLERADTLIGHLRDAHARDTLALRQHIFANHPDSAWALLGHMVDKNQWQNYPQERFLWTSRCALFSGRSQELGALLDSAVFSPSWEGAGELLAMQYRYQQLGEDAQAITDWGRIEHALYCGQPLAALRFFSPSAYLPRGATVLRLLLIEALLAADHLSQAAQLTAAIDAQQAQPRELFAVAEVLIRQGALEQARPLLERLILNHPHDIFSSKARVVLQQYRS